MSQSQYGYNFETGNAYLWEFSKIISTEWLLGIVFIILIFSLIFKRDRFTLSIAGIVIPTFLIVGNWKKKGLDYLLVIFPSLILMLGYWIHKFFGQKKYQKIIYATLIAILVLNIPRVMYLTYLHTREDTREIAGKWIMNHLPTGTSICYDHYHYDINLIDVERFTEYGQSSHLLSPQIKKKLNQLKNAANYYRFVPAQKSLKKLPKRVDSVSKITSDSYLTETLTHPHKTLQEIVNDGAQLLILNSDTYLKFLNNPPLPPENPLNNDFIQRHNFYKDIFDKMQPIKIISPNWNRPGPKIQIFDLRGKNR